VSDKSDKLEMRPADFKRWRKSQKLSQKEAAEALGLKRRVVQYYEKGERDGETVKIPKYIRLACYALATGIEDYQGPPHKAEEKSGTGPAAKPNGAAGPAAMTDEPGGDGAGGGEVQTVS